MNTYTDGYTMGIILLAKGNSENMKPPLGTHFSPPGLTEGLLRTCHTNHPTELTEIIHMQCG